MPDTFEALLIVILFIVPGFISQAVFGSLITRRQLEEQASLLEAIAFSCLNFGVWGWLVLVLPDLDDWQQQAEDHRAWVIAGWIVFLLLAPVAWGIVAAFLVRHGGLRWLFKRFRLDYRDPTPRAWDHYFGQGKPALVRVTLTDGTIIGGVFGNNSFASSYPSPEDLYLEQVHEVEADGIFSRFPAPRTDGVWIQGSRISHLEFINPR